MRFSFWPAPTHTFEETRQLAEHVENRSWDGLWLADHFMPNAEDTSASFFGELFGRRREDERFHRPELPEHVHVTGARLEAGMLHVDLVREIPEELKPRKIEINVTEDQARLEVPKAA